MNKPFEYKKAEILATISRILKENDYDVLITGSNELSIPLIAQDGDEGWAVITCKIPTGSRDGEPYDGFGAEQAYKEKCEEKARKSAEAEKKKAAKIEADRKAREEKAKLKAKKEEEG